MPALEWMSSGADRATYDSYIDSKFSLKPNVRDECAVCVTVTFYFIGYE